MLGYWGGVYSGERGIEVTQEQQGRRVENNDGDWQAGWRDNQTKQAWL